MNKMPRKAPKKTKEEKVAESYFPVDKSDLRNAIEKEYKQFDEKDLQKTEVEGKKKPKKKVRRKTKRVAKKRVGKIEFKPQKIALKKDGYELIITEKPQAAMKISLALGKAKKSNTPVPYYEVNRDGKNIIVACAVGHLFTLKQNKAGSEIPEFDISWVPNYMARKNDFTKRYYDVLLRLSKKAGSITVATDYDVEGEVIGLNVVRFICGQKDANRMKFSTLTEKELNKSYDEKSKSLNWGQAIAGETRHYLKLAD